MQFLCRNSVCILDLSPAVMAASCKILSPERICTNRNIIAGIQRKICKDNIRQIMTPLESSLSYSLNCGGNKNCLQCTAILEYSRINSFDGIRTYLRRNGKRFYASIGGKIGRASCRERVLRLV